ncbi:MAG: hypothetical protein HQL70_09625 [Magnetococcales bacterium]|nr:hypothetical protein [Magnetococcales bacterium]
MTTLSLNMRQEVAKSESSICPILLFTLTHDDLAEPIYISTDPTERIDDTSPSKIIYGTRSNGKEFIFLPMRAKLPSEAEGGSQLMKIELDDIHGAYREIVRQIQSPVSVTVDIVLADTPDTVETTWPEFLFTNITYDAETVSCDVVHETLITEPFPAGSFNPAYFPGGF